MMEECIVCLARPGSMDRPPATQLKPCGCLKLCVECALKVACKHPPVCPWCRSRIDAVNELLG